MQGLADCQRMIDRWSRHAESLAVGAGSRGPDASRPAGPMERALIAFTEALCDDLNVARAIAAINEALAQDHAPACPARELAALQRMDSVLAVLQRNKPLASDASDDLETKVNELLARRAAARAAKDWPASDRVRDELQALGVQIKDGPTGTTWSRVVR
jgi:cysteinyl-tRNA synthetase